MTGRELVELLGARREIISYIRKGAGSKPNVRLED